MLANKNHCKIKCTAGTFFVRFFRFASTHATSPPLTHADPIMSAHVRVVVASTNPVKLASAKLAFARVMPDTVCEFIPVSAPSGVSDQPMSDAETLRGARGRVSSARGMVPDADYYWGMEGGCEDIGGEVICAAWIVVTARDGLEGKAKTGMMPLRR